MKINEDIKLFTQDKVWSYNDANSLFGRKQLLNNIQEVFIYFIGCYLFCNRKIEDSIDVFSEIFNPGDAIVKASIDSHTNKVVVKLNQKNIVASRIAYLFEKLYRELGHNLFVKKEYASALQHLLHLEEKIGSSPLLYWEYILMARIYYETGSIPKAKEYTFKAKACFSKDTIEVCLNNGFFSILDNDVKGLYNNYKNIKGETVTAASEVISFLDLESQKYPNRRLLFDYAIAYLNFWYSDCPVGIQMLEEFINITVDNPELKKLRNDARNMLNKKKKRLVEYEKTTLLIE